MYDKQRKEMDFKKREEKKENDYSFFLSCRKVSCNLSFLTLQLSIHFV